MGYDNAVMAKHQHPFPQTVGELARLVGVGRVHLSEVLNHKTLPSVELAKRIELATGGAVQAADLLGLVHSSLPAAS